MVDVSLKYVDLYGDLEKDYKEFFKQTQEFEYPFGTEDDDPLSDDDDYYNDCFDDYEIGY